MDDIGRRVCAAGDFNGDGVDDFMFSCDNFNYGHPGAIFVVAGSMDIVTDVVDGDHTALPTRAILHQNYPNPFNASTVISYDLPRRSQVEITVYNILGRRVQTLVNCSQSAGTHSIEWDGHDATGNAVASGAYFYRLKTSEQSLTRKMLLLR